jgi:signal transduction histidine kinase/streptogramin lyase
MVLGRHSIRPLYGLISAVLGLCAGGCDPLLAQDQKIFQMIHTAWTARDGAPQNINAMTQAADGTLWFGTRDGLYSFDGLTFSAFQPASGSLPRRDVDGVFATKSGDLWAVGNGVRAVRIRDGVAALFDRVDNGRFLSLAFVQQSSDGTVWAILNSSKLVRLGADGIWHIVHGARPNSLQLNSFFIDSSDTQWLAADNLLYRRPHGQEAFTATEVLLFGPAKFKEAPDHTLWIAGYGIPGVKKPPPPFADLSHIDALGKRLPNPLLKEDDATDVAVAADGTLWVSHDGSGLQRLRAGEIKGIAVKEETDSPDTFGVSDGLTNTGFQKLLRDRDGNIWSSGDRGIDRFQQATLLAAVPAAMNGLWSVCIAPDGDVWLSRYEGFLGVFREHRLFQLKDRKDRPMEVGYASTYSMQCDGNGNVWFLGTGGVGEVHNDRVEKLPSLPGHGSHDDSYRFVSLAILPDHRLLASTSGPSEDRVWIYENGVWKLFPPASGITRIRALWQDARDNLYLGSASGQIIALEPPNYRVISTESSDIGPVGGFSETSYGIFAFGENGVALSRNGRFRTLFLANPAFSMTVTGLVEDHERDIWVSGPRAILRISSSEISSALRDRSYRVRAREFHEGEYRGSDGHWGFNSANIDSQGRIWLPTSSGVIYIDPQHVDMPSRVPTPSIRSISADGRPLGANHSFPAKTQTLHVHYFGLDLSDPKAVVYRYKLEGSDQSWQDAGDRTEAIYTHLRPAKYVFGVMASEGGAVWSQPVESEPFTILPAFYQTWWFEALAVLSGVLLLWAALGARLRYVSKGIKMRAEERATERIRIARELHDTLLQSVQGLLLSFHVAAEKVPDSHDSKQALEKALATADRVILDARDRLNRLRSEQVTSNEFEPSIEAFAADFRGPGKMEFAMECIGNRRPLNPDILEELCYIAREAITNSFRHSCGSHIVFTLDYGKNLFGVECRDDGRGFGEDTLREAESKGHWGFRGMAERADKIGARFSYESASGQGTRIRVVLPARRAYLRGHSLRTLFASIDRVP